MLGVRRDLESHQVRGQHAAHQLARPRQHPEHVRRGERDMQEEADEVVARQATQMVRHAQQLVIVDPQERARRARLGRGPRKALVHAVVGAPQRGIDARAAHEVVKEGPQRAIGEPGVVRRHLAGRQRHVEIAHARGSRGELRRRGAGVARQAVPPDPQPAALGQGRLQRRHEAAGRTRHPRPLGPGCDGERETVADDDERTWAYRGGAGGIAGGARCRSSVAGLLPRLPRDGGTPDRTHLGLLPRVPRGGSWC